ncbi:DNA polymerase IV [Leekyejoonella antrihumi]|uniref:DNA polymerase IV n=1 Tax=Leekyejoonella antrihumi TaxID=1660198 RepID=A0A563E6S4_9MICO|nr:DNA polymerase IV [Leekyejoonella antrihumi]TWP38240.1 DNA polymerase IV [Leekyejoonella antrihumi]
MFIDGGEEGRFLHADLDSFFASVEQRDDPSLRGRPVLVGGGVVVAASYEARAAGVRAPMGARAARRLCPDAVVVPPRMGAYAQASGAVFAIFRDITPRVEGISIDEAFLDVGGLRRLAGAPTAIGTGLRGRVRAEVGLPISVGIAGPKFLAKVASAAAKPDGLLSVPVGGELAFLHPLPVERLWGVGPVTAATLHTHGIATVGDLARHPQEWLAAQVGTGAARHLYALSQARDPRGVDSGRRRRSIGAQRAIGRGPHSQAQLDAVLVGLLDRVCGRLREAGRSARGVTLRVRFGDYTRATRSQTLDGPADSTPVLLAVARLLLASAHERIVADGITLLGVSLHGLDNHGVVQLALPFEVGAGGWDPPPAAVRDQGSLDRAVDQVRGRFGTSALTRGVLVGRDPGIQMPVLPDGHGAQ